MLMGAEVSTIEHPNVALVALKHDQPAQGFCKTWTVIGLQEKNLKSIIRIGLSKFC